MIGLNINATNYFTLFLTSWRVYTSTASVEGTIALGFFRQETSIYDTDAPVRRFRQETSLKDTKLPIIIRRRKRLHMRETALSDAENV